MNQFRASYEEKSFFKEDDERNMHTDEDFEIADKLMRITEQMSDKEGSLRGTRRRPFFGKNLIEKEARIKGIKADHGDNSHLSASAMGQYNSL